MIHVYPPTPLLHFLFDSKLISYPDFQIVVFFKFSKKKGLTPWDTPLQMLNTQTLI